MVNIRKKMKISKTTKKEPVAIIQNHGTKYEVRWPLKGTKLKGTKQEESNV